MCRSHMVEGGLCQERALYNAIIAPMFAFANGRMTSLSWIPSRGMHLKLRLSKKLTRRAGSLTPT